MNKFHCTEHIGIKIQPCLDSDPVSCRPPNRLLWQVPSAGLVSGAGLGVTYVARVLAPPSHVSRERRKQ